MAPRLHDRAAGKGRQMQRVSVVDKPEWSSLDCGFGVPRVGVRRINDRSLWTGRTTSSDLRISISSDTDIVIARQQGKALAIAMNFSLTDSAFIATTVSELARALLSHTVRGEIWLHQVYEPQRVGVIIVARDPIARDAANAGMGRLAFEAVAALATRALEALAGGPLTQHRALACELDILRAEASIRAGDVVAGKERCVRASATARDIGSPALAARAALAYGAHVVSGSVDPTMVTLLRDALESLGGPGTAPTHARERALVMARLAAAMMPPTSATSSAVCVAFKVRNGLVKAMILKRVSAAAA